MKLKPLFQHNLLIALFIIMLLPGLLALLTVCSHQSILFKWMTPTYKLNGITHETATPPLSLHHLTSHDVQKHIEDQVTQNLPLRSLLIRLNNQIYYSLFKKSYSEQGEIIIGKSEQLIVKSDIATYCANQTRHRSELTAWADKLLTLNTFFKKRNQTFIYVITPSKAEYMPDVIPKRFHCKNNNTTSHLLVMEQLLKERHIPYINSTTLMSAATEEYKIPMFPRGGIHWNTLGASIGVNATIQKINDIKHTSIKPLLFQYALSHEPKGQDRDMLNLLNLMRPNDNYVVPMVNFTPRQPSHPSLSVACIGGSFLRQMVDIFLQNNMFSNISFYRYFKLDKTDFSLNKQPIKQDVDLSSASALDAVLAADVVMLEENSAITVSNHGQLFYDMMKKFYI